MISPLNLGLAFFTIIFLGWVIWNFNLDAWWEPTDKNTVDNILKLAQLKNNEVLYDLGCGDGRIVITAAKKYGANAVGIEIDPVRFIISRIRARLSGVAYKVDIKLANMYEIDLSEADVVVLFLSRSSNSKLSPMLKEQLKPGARIVSYYHHLPDWDPVEVGTSADGYNLFLYKK